MRCFNSCYFQELKLAGFLEKATKVGFSRCPIINHNNNSFHKKSSSRYYIIRKCVRHWKDAKRVRCTDCPACPDMQTCHLPICRPVTCRYADSSPADMQTCHMSICRLVTCRYADSSHADMPARKSILFSSAEIGK